MTAEEDLEVEAILEETPEMKEAIMEEGEILETLEEGEILETLEEGEIPETLRAETRGVAASLGKNQTCSMGIEPR